MGKTEDSFEDAVLEIARKHIPDLKDSAVSINPSSNGNYTAITITFTAENQEQLDALYTELSKHPEVIMVL